MKNLVFFLLTISLSTISFSQSKYENGMKKAFDLWENDKSWEAANMFERIANVETDNWLPSFYVAQINVLNSFNEKDEATLSAQLKKAQDFLNDAKALSKDNAEILVIQAQIYTAWVIFDGQQYGMKYAGKISELYSKAQALEPDNPRAAFGKVEWDMGSARFFGQSIEPYCEKMKTALALFDTYELKGQFYPNGGGEYAKRAYEQNCKK